jgi:hypothetical protein
MSCVLSVGAAKVCRNVLVCLIESTGSDNDKGDLA